MSHKVFASDTPFSLVEAAEFQNYLSHFFTKDLKQRTLFFPHLSILCLNLNWVGINPILISINMNLWPGGTEWKQAL